MTVCVGIVVSQKNLIAESFKEWESLETLCQSKAAAKAAGLKSRLVSVRSLEKHVEADLTHICQLQRGDCKLEQAAHSFQSHFNLQTRPSLEGW